MVNTEDDNMQCVIFDVSRIESIGNNCRNVRGLGKSIVFFHLFAKLRYLNEGSTKFESLYQE